MGEGNLEILNSFTSEDCALIERCNRAKRYPAYTCYVHNIGLTAERPYHTHLNALAITCCSARAFSSGTSGSYRAATAALRRVGLEKGDRKRYRGSVDVFYSRRFCFSPRLHVNTPNHQTVHAGTGTQRAPPHVPWTSGGQRQPAMSKPLTVTTSYARYVLLILLCVYGESFREHGVRYVYRH